eukprot:9467407-Lingulodinium_polyedra.AAC.1
MAAPAARARPRLLSMPSQSSAGRVARRPRPRAALRKASPTVLGRLHQRRGTAREGSPATSSRTREAMRS